MSKYFFIFSVIILFSISCSQLIPNNIIPPEQMKKIMWQTSVAEGVYQSDTSLQTRTHLKDSITAAYERILNDNKINFATYLTSLKYYESHSNLMKDLLDSTLSYGTKIKDSFALHYHPVVPTSLPPPPPPPPPLNKNVPKPMNHQYFPHREANKLLPK